MISKAQRQQIVQRNIQKLEEYEREAREFFAWRERWQTHKLVIPRHIQGRWYWPGQTVYRRWRFEGSNEYWEYGTVFDVIKDSR